MVIVKLIKSFIWLVALAGLVWAYLHLQKKDFYHDEIHQQYRDINSSVEYTANHKEDVDREVAEAKDFLDILFDKNRRRGKFEGL